MSSIRDHSPTQKMTVVDSKWAAFSLLVAGIALGFTVASWNRMEYSDEKWAQSYKELEREKRLLQLKVDDMAFALKAHGIDPNPSHGGNSP